MTQGPADLLALGANSVPFRPALPCVARSTARRVAVMLLSFRASEVELAVEAAAKLSEQGKQVRVVSMPCTERFDKQDAAYREAVLPKAVRARVAVEALQADFWGKYVGLDGVTVGMTSFGESAPAGELFKLFGFTVENVVDQSLSLLNS